MILHVHSIYQNDRQMTRHTAVGILDLQLELLCFKNLTFDLIILLLESSSSYKPRICVPINLVYGLNLSHNLNRRYDVVYCTLCSLSTILSFPHMLTSCVI